MLLMKLRIKELRTKRGLTIDQLASMSGLSRGFISLLENGKRDPSADTLGQLSDALGVPLVDLIDEGHDRERLNRLLAILARLSADDCDRILLMAEALADRQG